MSHQEEKINKFLDYPYDSFLMIRLEFMLIFRDELTAKVLRIIEKNVDTERKQIYRKTVNKMNTPPSEVVDVTKDIWVSISYKTFMSDLFDTVTSENTLKRAIKELERMKVIFRRHDQKKRYDAPQYKIHQSVLQMLLSVLKMPGYQNLIPSIFEALRNLPPQEMTPSECQILIPSNFDLSTNDETRVSKFDTNYNSNTNKGNNKNTTYSREIAEANHETLPPSLSLEEMVALVKASGYQILPPENSENVSPIFTEDVNKHTENVDNAPPEIEEKDVEQTEHPIAAKTTKKRQPAQPREPKPVPPPIVLTEDEQAFYDLYCSLAMIKIKPPVTEKVKEQCGQLAPHFKTQKQLYSLWNWMNKNDFYAGKGFRLGMIITALNDWNTKQGNGVPTAQEQLEEKATGFNMLSQAQLARLPLEKRKEYGQQFTAHIQMQKEVEKQQQAQSQKVG